MKNKLKLIIGGVVLAFIILTLLIKLTIQKEIENFDTFNHKFHSDSIFQMSRINFPIKGQLIDGFENHHWNAENWQLMTTEVGSKNLPKEFKEKVIKTDSQVIESIWIENSGLNWKDTSRKLTINGF